MMTQWVDILDQLTVPGELYTRREGGMLVCHACAHRCKIKSGRRGVCQVRFERQGELRVPWGYVAALQTDPIEKKPFSHLLPGSEVLTFGMLGCDFHCEFCQNWVSSQALRDPRACLETDYLYRTSPEELVQVALRNGAELIASSYNEPLITSEWAVAIFKQAVQQGLKCAYVSNGNATPEVLDYLRPYLTAYKVDLKSMQELNYRQMGGVLKNVLDTIQRAHDLGMWVEVVTLVIPGFNDSPEELWETARFLVSVSADIPWHVTAFHPDYKMTKPPPTTAENLRQAADIGQEAGLKHVYAGNLPGRVGSLEDTYCPHCQTLLIQRRGYVLLGYQLTAAGSCPKCGTKLAGVWAEDPSSVRLGGKGYPRRVQL
jgi:pyruvate formate lyase activating enzyme